MTLINSPESLSDTDYQFLVNLVYERSRISLGGEKRELVAARLGKRLRHHGMSRYGDYCKFLRTPAGEDELTHLIDAISTNHTFFFREIKHFEFLNTVLLPEFSRKSPGAAFRCWSAASSTGEEPYSIAITLAEWFGRPGSAGAWTLDASDISTKVLAKAREGIYPADRLQEVSAELIRRYFLQGKGEATGLHQVKPELRSQVRFHHLNLFQRQYPFRDPFHLIFCRNVMIYFDRSTQEQLVARLHDLILPGGYLFVGHSESLTGIRHAFRMIRPAIYQKAPKTG